jgi:hypothetical protein
MDRIILTFSISFLVIMVGDDTPCETQNDAPQNLNNASQGKLKPHAMRVKPKAMHFKLHLKPKAVPSNPKQCTARQALSNVS